MEVGRLEALRKRLTFANVMSAIAVFIALGGSAYAIKLKRNSVKSKQIAPAAVQESEIADGAVTNPKIAAGAVDGGKVADGALATGDLADGSVTAAKLGVGETRVTFANDVTVIGPATAPDMSEIRTGGLPAGSYAVFATVNWHAGADPGETRRAECTLSPSSGAGFDKHVMLIHNGATNPSDVLGTYTTSLMLTTSIPNGAQFRLVCDHVQGANFSLDNRKIVPIRLKSQLQEGVAPIDSG